MRKTMEFAFSILLAVTLGGALFLALVQQLPSQTQVLTDQSQTGRAQQSSQSVQVAAPTAFPPRSHPMYDASAPISVAPDDHTTRPDLEDVLLLTNTNETSDFDRYFCSLAEFYGLLCRQVAVNQTAITAGLLRDPAGKPFKLIVARASVFYAPGWVNSEEHAAIIQAVSDQGSNLLLTDLDQWIHPNWINLLSSGQLQSVIRPADANRDWLVSSDFPQITREFTGKFIKPDTRSSQRDNALVLPATSTLKVLLSSKDDQGNSYPIFAYQDFGQAGGKVFYNAAEKWAVGDNPNFYSLFYRVSSFSQFAPVLFTLRYTMGDEAWHRDANYANLTIDDSVLQEPYHSLDYYKLEQQMESQHFFTTLALSPNQWQSWHGQVIGLILAHPGRFSLAMYGNHSAWANTGIGADPAVGNLQMGIAEGLARMTMLQNSTGLSFDRVMVLSSRAPTVQSLDTLRKQGYLAVTNTSLLPAGAPPSNDPFEGLTPADLNYAGFPILIRRMPGSLQPFQPNISPVLYDLFFEKPVLLYTDPSQNDLVDQGMAAFQPVTQVINGLSEKPQWLSLGEIVRHLYLQKTNDDGSIDVRMYTNELVYKNTTGAREVFHFVKAEPGSGKVPAVSVNGRPVTGRWEKGWLHIDLSIPNGTNVMIRVAAGQQ